jgi:hypothetical protein
MSAPKAHSILDLIKRLFSFVDKEMFILYTQVQAHVEYDIMGAHNYKLVDL